MVNVVSQNVLLIDLGNSAVKWAFSSEPGQLNLLQKRNHANATEAFFSELWKDEVKPDAVFVSSVAHEQIWMALEQACLHLWDIQPEKIVTPQRWQGLTNAYAQSFQLGSDRWCAMVGAFQEAGSDFIVVDCGTAITIDVVRNTGQHLGGYILPGIKMMQQSLGMQTAQINIAHNQDEHYSLKPGTSTTGCVHAGVYLAAVKAIEAVIKEQEEGLDNIQCYLTGGDAEAIAALLSVKYVMIPDLVLRGLACIAEQQKANNN